MASDSEPRKIFFEAPSRPLRSHISGSKKPVRLLMSNDSAGVKLANSNDTIRYDTIEEFNVDSKAEYTA